METNEICLTGMERTVCTSGVMGPTLGLFKRHQIQQYRVKYMVIVQNTFGKLLVLLVVVDNLVAHTL